jgi:hypothetical protein
MCRKVIFLVCFALATGLLAPAWAEGAVSDPNIALWYKLDETDGNTAYDSSDYGRDGEIYQWPEDAGFTVNWEPNGGHYGGCLAFFDDTRITAPKSALSTVANGITVSLWLKDAWRVGQNCAFGACTGEEATFRVTAYIGTAPDAEVLWQAGNDTNDMLRYDMDSSSVEDLEGWHLWIFVKDETAGNIRIYLDGMPAASKGAVDNTLSTVLPAELAKGAFKFRVAAKSWYYNDLKGKIDEFRVYDRALSDGEVERLYYTGGDEAVAWKPDPADGAEDLCPDAVVRNKLG